MVFLFTGIVQEIGVFKDKIRSNNRYQLIIEGSKVLGGVSRGDSIAVNGVCLTVVDFTEKSFRADVMPETLRATNLSKLKPGSKVNLEQALSANGLLGGHIMTGHVDGLGVVKRISSEKNARVVEIEVPPDLLNYLVDKGSIAVNGVSLTIMKVNKYSFTLSLIPETWNYTNLKEIKIEDQLNIETDLIGKYVYKMINNLNNNITSKGNNNSIDKDFLQENGFL
ncbi:MAG: riboflavin synthase [Halanaerobiaceae bacterium]